MSKLYAYHFAQFLNSNPQQTEITTKHFIEYLEKSDQPELASNYIGISRLYKTLCTEGILEISPKKNPRNVKYYKVVNLDNERETPDSEITLRTLLLSMLDETDTGLFSVTDRDVISKGLIDSLEIDQQNRIGRQTQKIKWMDNPLRDINGQFSVVIEQLQRNISISKIATIHGISLTYKIGDKDCTIEVFPYEIQVRNGRLLLVCMNEVRDWIWIPLTSVLSSVANSTRLEMTSNEDIESRIFIRNHVNPPMFDFVSINDNTLIDIVIQFDESAWDKFGYYINDLESEPGPVPRSIVIEHIDDIHLANWIQSIGGKRIL